MVGTANGAHDIVRTLESMFAPGCVSRPWLAATIMAFTVGAIQMAHSRADFWALFQQSLSCLPWLQTSSCPDAFASLTNQADLILRSRKRATLEIKIEPWICIPPWAGGILGSAPVLIAALLKSVHGSWVGALRSQPLPKSV